MNKKISIIGILILIIIVTATSILITACKKNDSTSSCDRTCYFGTWAVSSQDCGSGYTVSIVASSTDGSSIEIHSFDDFGSLVYITAKVSGSTFSFSNQAATSNTIYSGSGTLSSDEKTISINYTDTNDHGSIDETCSVTWTKQ